MRLLLALNLATLVVSSTAQAASTLAVTTLTSIRVTTTSSAVGLPTLTQAVCLTSTNAAGSTAWQCSTTAIPSYTSQVITFTTIITSTIGAVIQQSTLISTEAQSSSLAVDGTVNPTTTSLSSANSASATSVTQIAHHPGLSTGLVATLVALALVLTIFGGCLAAWMIKRSRNRSGRIRELETALAKQQKGPSSSESTSDLFPIPAKDSFVASTATLVSANIRNPCEDFDGFSFVSVVPGQADRHPCTSPKPSISGQAVGQSSACQMQVEHSLENPNRDACANPRLRPVSEIDASQNPKSIWLPGMPLNKFY